MFFAVSPLIALAARIKKYWLALVIAEFYSVGGLFAGMGSVSKTLYPITALFNFTGYQATSPKNVAIGVIVLLLCAVISGLILKDLNCNRRE